MFPRELQLPENSNFFLFGARGTGKSTLLRQKFGIQNCLNFDLLNLDLEMSLARDPMNLAKQVLALPPAISHVILDDVQNWYQVLEDTLVGFFLDAFHTSVRQQIRVAPKFYFYDVGVARALALMLSVVPGPGTSYYGDLFEQLVISQIKATNHNRDNDYTMSYLMTKSGMKVDLVLERPGKPLALIEIKSKSEVTEQDALNLRHFEKDFPQAEFFLFSLDPIPKRLGKVKAMHWQEGLESGI